MGRTGDRSDKSVVDNGEDKRRELQEKIINAKIKARIADFLGVHSGSNYWLQRGTRLIAEDVKEPELKAELHTIAEVWLRSD